MKSRNVLNLFKIGKNIIVIFIISGKTNQYETIDEAYLVHCFNFVLRWDVLMEILDAQKERISRIELPSGMESALMNDKDQDALGRL